MVGNGSEGAAATNAPASRSGHRRLAVLLAAVVLCGAAGAAGYWWWTSGERAGLAVPVERDLADIEEWSAPAVSAPGYLGVDVCTPCHARRVAEFKSTRHFVACRAPAPGLMPSGFAPGKGLFKTHETGLRYEMVEREGGFFQTAIPTADGAEKATSARIALAYGSGGVLDEVYFTWHGDRLYELPMVWLHPQHRFAIVSHNPYGDGGDYSRETTTRCLECHNTWFEHVPGSRNQYKRDQAILGVACEKCHGPGPDHVAYHAAHPGAEAAHAVVNPGRLSRERLLEVCTQCHSNAIRPRTRAFAYRPGEALDDYFKSISTRVPDDDHVANQVQYLRQSKCFQKSPEMTCTTCHNPHRPHEPGKTGSSERSCFKCHQGADCAEQQRIPAELRENCVGCHMPARAWMNVHFHTEDDQYVPPIRRYQHRIAVDPVATKEVLLGWHRTQPGEASQRAVARLSQELTDYWLSEAQRRRHEYRFLAAIGAYREALRIEPSSTAHAGLRDTIRVQADLNALLVAGMHELDLQRFDAAVSSLEKVLAIKPDHAIAHGKLGTAYAALGRSDLAAKHLQAVSLHDPNEPYGEIMLGWLAYLDGRTDDAAAAYRRADALEPFNVKTHYHWALALAKAGRLSESATHFREALTIAPDHVGACQGLTGVLLRQGKPEDAIRFAKRAARLTGHKNPEILLDLGDAYAAAGRLGAAAAVGTEALDAAAAHSPVLAAQVRRQMEQWKAVAKKAQR
jgi:tetratricopeptide (TPR) repeat protein